MSHMPGNQGHKIKDWFKGFQKKLKDSEGDRAKQFANYLSMVDSYSKKRVSLKGSMVGLGNLQAKSGRVSSTPNVTKMTTILDRYHDRALRLAQAKYYQKQVG